MQQVKDSATIQNEWAAQGFCYFPNFLSTERCQVLRQICDRVLHQWRTAQQQQQLRLDSINMAYLTDPVYFEHQPDELIALLELIADPHILDSLAAIAGQPILFHNTQYFFEPPQACAPSMWHRDSQFLAPEPEQERQRMQAFSGVHFRIAFLPDSYLEYVPGSEQRWDTPAEHAIRKGLDGQRSDTSDMPGKQTLHLKPGDGLLFHAWGIHRGNYNLDKPRRTLDILYQWGAPLTDFSPLPTCFQQPDRLLQLSDRARQFFQRFIDTYQPYW